MKLEQWMPPFSDTQLLGLAELFVQTYDVEHWNQVHTVGEVAQDYRQDLARDGIEPMVAVVIDERELVTAYTAGMILAVDDVAQITEMMVEAPYMGGVLGEEKTRAEMEKFWQEVEWGAEIGRVLFIYDTLRDQGDECSLSPWLETAVAACDWALSEGVSQFVGMTMRGTQILQMLEAMKTVTYSQTCERVDKMQPVLVYSSDLARIERVFKAVKRGVQ